MIVKAIYPCRIDGVMPGKRKVETVYVLREKMLDIRELPDAPVEAIRIDSTTPDYMNQLPGRGPGHAPLFGTKTDTSVFYAIDGSGCYASEPVSGVFGDTAARWQVRRLFDLKIGVQDAVAVMPAFSRVEEDHQVATEARMERIAAKLVIHGDRVYFPTNEPYIGVGLDGNERTKDMRVFSGMPETSKLVYSNFPLDQLDRARALAGRRPAAEDHLGKFDARYAITVSVPGALAYDPDRPAITAMARAVIASVKVILGDLTRPQVTAWLDLRDESAKFQANRERMGDTAPILQAITRAMDAFAPLDRMKASTVAEFRADIARLAKDVPDEADLGEIAEAFSP